GPGVTGTNQFTYIISDTYGLTATGTVTVIMTDNPNQFQQKAVDDAAVVAAAENVKYIDVLANDLRTSLQSAQPSTIETTVGAVSGNGKQSGLHRKCSAPTPWGAPPRHKRARGGGVGHNRPRRGWRVCRGEEKNPFQPPSNKFLPKKKTKPPPFHFRPLPRT